MFATLLILLCTTCTFAAVKMKIATLAPKGSTWMVVMDEMNDEIKKQTDGRAYFKVYAGGVQGDEKDVLLKIQFGQLHGGAFTGLGMGKILPSVRMLDMPLLFQDTLQVDKVTEGLFDWYSAEFEKKGYILLGWAEVGMVYMFSNTEIKTLDDLQSLKMWSWEGDPVADATFKAFGMKPIPTSVPDVLTSLQTGLVDAVYASPLAAIALQWNTKVKYMVRLPLTNSAGAVLVSKKRFLKISPEDQLIIKETCRKSLKKLQYLSRRDNLASIEIIKKQGVKIIAPPIKPGSTEYNIISKAAQGELLGTLFSPAELKKVLDLLKP